MSTPECLEIQIRQCPCYMTCMITCRESTAEPCLFAWREAHVENVIHQAFQNAGLRLEAECPGLHLPDASLPLE